MKAEQEQKEQQEHIQQVTNQNVTLINMAQEPQKKLEELMSASNTLLDKMIGADSKDNQSKKRKTKMGAKEKRRNGAKHNQPPWYKDRKNQEGTQQDNTQEWQDGGSKHNFNSDIIATK